MKKRSAVFLTGTAITCFMLCCSATTVSTNKVASSKIGVINFKTCLEGSKLGKQEQARFEEIKKQLEATIEAKEKELNEMTLKFNEEYLDTLTPEAEAELKERFKHLSQDLSQHQNQYYHLLNQAYYQIEERLTSMISKAAEAVAKENGLEVAQRKEALFYYDPSLDISAQIIAKMDAEFVSETNSSASSPSINMPTAPSVKK